MIENYDSVDVFIGVDVGKSEHHAVAFDRSGKRLYDKALPNDEARLRAVIEKLKRRGQVLLVAEFALELHPIPAARERHDSIVQLRARLCETSNRPPSGR